MTDMQQTTDLLGPEIDRSLIADLPRTALLHRYKLGIEAFDPRLFRLDDEQLDQAFLPDAGVGRWPVRVVLGHLADDEIVLTHRMRRTVAEDSPVLGVFDENAFVDGGIYGSTSSDAWPNPGHPIGAHVAVMYTMREWTGSWLASLPEEAMARTAMHPEHGELTLRGMIEFAVWHLEHHARFVNAKINSFLGPMTEEDIAQFQSQAGASCGGDGTGGCGPGCGCG